MAYPSTADRIAQAALAILEAEGLGAASMRRVADAVGITPMAIYHHFPNREELLNTITNQQFATFLSYIESAPCVARPRRSSSPLWRPTSTMLSIGRASSTTSSPSPAPEHAAIPTTSAPVARLPSIPSPTRSTPPCAPACSAKTMSGKLLSNSGPSPTETTPFTVPAVLTCPRKNSARLCAAP